MILLGIPNTQTQLRKNISATSLAVQVVLQGTNLTYLEKRSTIVKMASKPLDAGKDIMKSMVTCLKGPEGFSTGYNVPIGGSVEDLFA